MGKDITRRNFIKKSIITDADVWPIPLDTASLPNTLGKSQPGNRWPLLYDLSLDPGESYNVINTYPDIARKLKNTMKEWRKKIKRNPCGFKVC